MVRCEREHGEGVEVEVGEVPQVVGDGLGGAAESGCER